MSKRKKKKKNYYVLADFILIIIIVLAGFFFMNKITGKDTEKDKPKEEEKKDDNKKEEPVKEKYSKEVDAKLKKLDYINEKLDFFKMDYIDKYISYKEKNNDLDLEKVIIYVNIGLDNDYYTNVKDSPNKYTNTVLSNKYYFLGEDYEPKNLTLIDSKYAVSNDKYMEKDAANAFTNLAKDAKSEGYTILASSTYRSYKYQTGLYNRYKEQDGKEKADTYSARAGYSEHQTGLAVDVTNGSVSYTKFGTTKEFDWMKKNAYKYGFILRYTKETEFITGYMNEPWHYRYVGKEIAEYIQNHPMTYEEYYVRFLDK
jgi:D-alanyl-D-alanine carboxypeptidase